MNPLLATPFPAATAILIALLFGAVPTGIAAQQPRRVAVGDRVRVEATTESGTRFGPTVVTFQGATADTLFLRKRLHVGGRLYWDSLMAIHRLAVKTLEVRGGPHRHARTGAIVVGSLGAAFGAALLLTPPASPPGQVVAAAVLFGGAGAGLGALLGLAIPGTGPWVPAEIPATRLDGDSITASSQSRVKPKGFPRSTTGSPTRR